MAALGGVLRRELPRLRPGPWLGRLAPLRRAGEQRVERASEAKCVKPGQPGCVDGATGGQIK